ncbi:hypothetical protein [Haliscomenobacter hydrossis]|uniref:Uncharacterized protein n=1 Tax=Haliscomenobacter hydrossis (strain ATCC 27775 / DSM 1100 / LMG 10767 / O) TaxID=760192 RepID=F4L1R0_HALH1|nr:hypothetical protein [Haliscomenobacter hydrossis]AEE49569.1 hypothetical protein Halhy_1680 [Haliscomenobacter hydrossis DSM 1100]
MNAVFEPSLLFIADEDWWDDEKRDAFLEHLLDHLEMLDEYDICKIWWTDELQTILVGDPNMHPWFGSDLRNPLIVTIHQKFYQHTDSCFEFPPVCDITPPLVVNYTNPDAHESFLKLVHALIDLEENFYFCVGLYNRLSIGAAYSFTCDCHSHQLQPTILNAAEDWLNFLDAVAQFFPTSIEAFDSNFIKGLELVRRKFFAGAEYRFDFEFSKAFKKSVIHRTTHREAIFMAIVKKLTSTSAESGSSDLHDEFLSKIKEWRIRVTQRPSSTRIHYAVQDKKIIFLKYYGEGEHDDGL